MHDSIGKCLICEDTSHSVFQLTGIVQDMVDGQPFIEDVLKVNSDEQSCPDQHADGQKQLPY